MLGVFNIERASKCYIYLMEIIFADISVNEERDSTFTDNSIFAVICAIITHISMYLIKELD